MVKPTQEGNQPQRHVGLVKAESWRFNRSAPGASPCLTSLRSGIYCAFGIHQVDPEHYHDFSERLARCPQQDPRHGEILGALAAAGLRAFPRSGGWLLCGDPW